MKKLKIPTWKILLQNEVEKDFTPMHWEAMGRAVLAALRNVKEREREMIRVEEAAQLLGVSQQSVRNWTRKGFLHAFTRTVGQHRRYARSEILKFREVKKRGKRI